VWAGLAGGQGICRGPLAVISSSRKAEKPKHSPAGLHFQTRQLLFPAPDPLLLGYELTLVGSWAA